MTMRTYGSIGFFEEQANHLDNLSQNLDTLWVILVSMMVLLSRVGFFMREIGSIKRAEYNSTVVSKNFSNLAVTSITFFILGFGLSCNAKGGFIGQQYFFGSQIVEDQQVGAFLFYFSLAVMMSSIASGSLAERTPTDTYIFFSFIISVFIFPFGAAWAWGDGWLENIGFKDYGGAAIVHIMGGLSGFMGTLLIGARIGKFKSDEVMSYVLKDKYLEDDESNILLNELLRDRINGDNDASTDNSAAASPIELFRKNVLKAKQQSSTNINVFNQKI